MALLVEQATLELRSTSASDGVESVAVALLLVEQAILELRSSSASDVVESVVVALLEEQTTLELRSTRALAPIPKKLQESTWKWSESLSFENRFVSFWPHWYRALHGTQEDQRGPIESELSEYGHSGCVLAPVIGRYGGASSDLGLILDLVAREMARKHTAFYSIGFSEAKALFRQKLVRRWGHAIARGWATLLLDRLRDFVVTPPLRAETLLLSCTLRAWRSVPLWTATITTMVTRACAPD